jgi:hypothetical protein
MKTPTHSKKQQSRCAYVAASRMVGATMLATLFTTKIKPHWVSGGLPKEGNP